MRKRRRRIPVARAEALATPPGTLTAPADALPSQLSVLAYGKDHITDLESADVAQIAALRGSHDVTWVNMVGLGHVQLLEQLEDEFGLHRLALEDTLNVPQRPKIDDYDEHQYVVARMPISTKTLKSEQISVFFGDGFLITVQERPGDCFDGVRARIRDGRPRLRSGGSDYLAYAVLDALVDSYFPLIETIAGKIDDLELSVLSHASKEQLSELHDTKRDLVILRQYLEPLRELISTLIRPDNDVLSAKTKVFMRDCHDHCRQAFDLVETYRTNASNVMDLHLSMAGQRMNEVMKVLTVIATLFIPLSFIAGLYGMNFDPGVSRWNMPELGWSYGYPFAIGLMVACAFVMLTYFWRKGWFR